ncbi:DUF6153 family protein [Streptomyces diastatochromogenes]|nr:DUF6153 family protein [Streptomyces diastatochromogenes]
MHALGPGGGTGHAEHARAAHTMVTVIAHDDCPEGAGHCGGHRMHHADPTCASGAVNGGPHLPALVPDLVTAPHRPPTRARARSRRRTGPVRHPPGGTPTPADLEAATTACPAVVLPRVPEDSSNSRSSA